MRDSFQGSRQFASRGWRSRNLILDLLILNPAGVTVSGLGLRIG
jgi:hypothetical protein